MNYYLIGAISITVLSSVIYKYYDEIKMEYSKLQSKRKSNQIIIDFFINQININENITLEEAILKFENAFDKYDNLNDFAISKKRTVDNYYQAYSKLFKDAKLKNSKKIETYFLY